MLVGAGFSAYQAFTVHSLVRCPRAMSARSTGVRTCPDADSGWSRVG